MDDCPAGERWQQFVNCQIPPSDRPALERHLEVCDRCGAEVERLLRQRMGDLLPETRPHPPPARPSARPQLPNYDVLERVGTGGFGEVWRALYQPLKQRRAVKVLHLEHFSDQAVAALRAEAQIMAALPPHRNRVPVYDLIESSGGAVLAMGYVEGGALSQRGLPLHWERAVRYVSDAAEGLEEVHAAGILHRDIKPANLLWDPQRDTVLLGDFGLAAHADRQPSWGGTLGYMAPEVLEFRAASAKSDVFALAATLFHLMTGGPPFTNVSLVACLAEAREGLRHSMQGVPRGVEKAIRAGLDPDPERRPGLSEFRTLLQQAHLWELAEELRRQVARATCPTRLDVTVATADQRERKFREVLSWSSRDVPAGEEHTRGPVAHARTGDLMRITAQADTEGYVTVLNFSSSGQLEVLFPNPVNRDNALRSGRPQSVTVQLTPPATTERTAIIWTLKPNAGSPAEWRERIVAGEITEIERGMVLVPEERDWTAVVVTVLHGEEHT
jgi:serine/threonine protein kinase